MTKECSNLLILQLDAIEKLLKTLKMTNRMMKNSPTDLDLLALETSLANVIQQIESVKITKD